MTTPLAKTIDYLEIPSRDISASREFFRKLFGWAFTDYGPDYTSFDDGRITGGFFTAERVSLSAEGACLPVIYTPALEQTRAEAMRLGATLTRDIFPFPGGRRFQFTEPGGSEFSVWSEV